ncbi:MAG: hypothetical protein LBQ58_11170 [Synergistaceae bacterium]|jgi:predicted  nucleic acid-binding Zn-ribbon protein|nr:hypothetical protein [Synergistaceae bacterium]
MVDVEIFVNDQIKMIFLDELLRSSVEMRISIDNGSIEGTFLELRGSGGSYQYGEVIQVTESTADNSVSLSPARMNGTMDFLITIKNAPPKGSYISVLRYESGATVSKMKPLKAGVYYIRLSPADDEKYAATMANPDDDIEANLERRRSGLCDRAKSLSTSMDDLIREISELERGISKVSGEIGELERRRSELADTENALSVRKVAIISEMEILQSKIEDASERINRMSGDKESLGRRLETIQSEYEKDYARFEDEISDIKARYRVDSEILTYYKDRDPHSIEEMISKAGERLDELEDQIRLFAEARRKESEDIEEELQMGKKRMTGNSGS